MFSIIVQSNRQFSRRQRTRSVRMSFKATTVLSSPTDKQVPERRSRSRVYRTIQSKRVSCHAPSKISSSRSSRTRRSSILSVFPTSKSTTRRFVTCSTRRARSLNCATKTRASTSKICQLSLSRLLMTWSESSKKVMSIGTSVQLTWTSNHLDRIPCSLSLWKAPRWMQRVNRISK